MMCANFSNLEKSVTKLDQAGVDIFHIDIMDGIFVPNFGMGLQDFEYIRSQTQKLIDVHLMIENPANYVNKFADMGADIIYIHSEADRHPARTLDMIHEKGKKSGIAINPGTSVESVIELFPMIDYILIMTVNPEFAGQKYLEFVTEKIKKIAQLKSNYSFEIILDGAISEEKIKELRPLGATGFVLGTSSLFGKTASYANIIENLRK